MKNFIIAFTMFYVSGTLLASGLLMSAGMPFAALGPLSIAYVIVYVIMLGAIFLDEKLEK